MKSAWVIDTGPQADVSVGADGEELTVVPDSIAMCDPPVRVRNRDIDRWLDDLIGGDYHVAN